MFKSMLGEYRNSEIVLDNFISIRVPRNITILGIIVATGVMEHDLGNNRIMVTYHITGSNPGLTDREYKITASRSLDFTNSHSEWLVNAYADTRRSIPHAKRAKYQTRTTFDVKYRNISLEELLKEAAEWIGKEIVKYGLENITIHDHSWDILEEKK